MPKVTFIEAGGRAVTISDAAGDLNLMEIATQNSVAGIEGSCGGVCSCATCHVWVAPEWAERVGPASEIERELLDFEPNANSRSRLCCQIELTGELDGLALEVAV